MTNHTPAALEWARRTPLTNHQHAPVRAQRLVLLTLATYADDHAIVDNVTQDALSRVTGTSADHIRRVVRALEGDGLIETIPGTGRGITSRYRLTGRPWGALGVHGARFAAARRSA